MKIWLGWLKSWLVPALHWCPGLSLLSKPAQIKKKKLYCYSTCSSFSTGISSVQEQFRGSLFMAVGWGRWRWQAQEPCRPFIDAITSTIISSAKDQYLEQKRIRVTFLNSERPRCCWRWAGTRPTPPPEQKGLQEKPNNPESSWVNYGPSPQSISVMKNFQ